ncbi:hypothetical protein NE237_013734 [Protea cynaroides]|uniref:Uncharacterized protein n=1 Tax=Protea cynaroides TaxID=273540 RepID=A0A9Q0H1J1_9MAGN|nr:hypothetical protein NE237_013734 [Protea cynaroides]
MAMFNAKCLSINSPNNLNPSKQSFKPISLLSLQNLPKGLTISKASTENSNFSPSLAGTAIAGAVLSTLSSCDIAEGANHGLALLLPIIPAIAWVLFNILQPALNWINQMQSSKGIIVGLSVGDCGTGLCGSLDFESLAHSSFVAETVMGEDVFGDDFQLLDENFAERFYVIFKFTFLPSILGLKTMCNLSCAKHNQKMIFGQKLKRALNIFLNLSLFLFFLFINNIKKSYQTPSKTKICPKNKNKNDIKHSLSF